MSLIKDTYEYARRDRTILCKGMVARVDTLSAVNIEVDAKGPYVRFYPISGDPAVKDIDVKDEYKDNLSSGDLEVLLNQLAYDISEFIQSSNESLPTFDIQSKFNRLVKELIDGRECSGTSDWYD